MIGQQNLKLMRKIWTDLEETDNNKIRYCIVDEVVDLINLAREEGRQEMFRAKQRVE